MGKIQSWVLPAALLTFSGAAIVWAQETRQVENPMRIILDEKYLAIYNKDQVVLRYRYDDVPFKPYAQELFTPGGINILRDAPHDHLHHHALMFAVTVDGVNFWEEQQVSGRQEHKSLGENKIGKRDDIARAGFQEKIDWLNPRTKEVLLKEERTIEAAVMTGEGATLVNWTMRFVLPVGKEKATISGAHYHGLGMRFLESMDKEGKFFNATGKEGKVYRGDERLVRADWCAYSAQAKGKPVTVAMFAHPDNLRHPTTWFTMKKPFAYLSATMEVYNKPYVLKGKGELVLRYGVVVWDGTTGPKKIEKTYENWVSTYSQANKDTDKKENYHDEGKSKK